MGVLAIPVGGLLAACGGSSSKTTPTTASSETTATTAATSQSTSSASGGATPAGTTAPAATAASTSASGSAPSPTSGGTLTIGLEQEPSTLDPHASANAMSHRPNVCLYDSLVIEDDQMQLLARACQTSGRVSTDGKTYTFTLTDWCKISRRNRFQRGCRQIQFRSHHGPSDQVNFRRGDHRTVYGHGCRRRHNRQGQFLRCLRTVS